MDEKKSTMETIENLLALGTAGYAAYSVSKDKSGWAGLGAAMVGSWIGIAAVGMKIL